MTKLVLLAACATALSGCVTGAQISFDDVSQDRTSDDRIRVDVDLINRGTNDHARGDGKIDLVATWIGEAYCPVEATLNGDRCDLPASTRILECEAPDPADGYVGVLTLFACHGVYARDRLRLSLPFVGGEERNATLESDGPVPTGAQLYSLIDAESGVSEERFDDSP